MNGFTNVFGGDNLRYLTELRGSPLSRFYYNKITILVSELGKFLSFYNLRLYFGPLFLIVFFPFWLVGVIDLAARKKWKVFVFLLLAGIPVHLINKREFIYLLPIALVYGYITYIGIIHSIKLLKKWQNKK